MGGDSWFPAQLCKCSCPHAGGHSRPPDFPAVASLPTPSPELQYQPILITASPGTIGCHGNSGWSRQASRGQSPTSGTALIWIRESVGYSNTWCFVEFYSYNIHNTALCGLRLLVAYVLLFAFPHCLLFAPSVHGNWLLLREANPTCFAISSVLWLGKQREGIAHLAMGPRRFQGRTPGWEVPVGWGCVYFSCVHMGQLGLHWNRSAERAGWCG